MIKKLTAVVWLIFAVSAILAIKPEPAMSKTKSPEYYKVTARVVDKENNAPIADAAVGYSLLVENYERTTDANGTATLGIRAPGTYSIYARHKNFKDAAQNLTIKKDGPAEFPLTLMLERKEDVKMVNVLLMDTSGQPIPEARVYLEGDTLAAIYTGETDQSGRAFWYVTHPGKYSVSVYHGHFKTYKGELEVKKYGEQKGYNLQITLERADKKTEEPIVRKLSVEVKGIDWDGKTAPLPKATVYFMTIGKQTDKQGAALFEHSLDIGTYAKVYVEAKDYEPKMLGLVVGEGGRSPLVHRPARTSRFTEWIRGTVGAQRPPDDVIRVTLNPFKDALDFIVEVRDGKDSKLIDNSVVSIKLREPVVIDGQTKEYYADYLTRNGMAKFSLPADVLSNIGSLRVFAVGYEKKWTDIAQDLLKINGKPRFFVVYLKKEGQKEEESLEKTLVFAVKGKDPEGAVKPLPNAAVSFNGEARKTDETGMAEFKLKVPENAMSVEASGEAVGYDPAQLKQDVKWETETAMVEMVLNQKPVSNLIVDVRDEKDKPVKGAVVQIRLKSDTGKTEAQSVSGDAGEAKLYAPSKILDKALFVAVSHPDYEEKWSDISLTIPNRSGPGTEDVRYFVVHLKKKGRKEEVLEKTLIFSVKGKDLDGTIKPLKGALVIFRKTLYLTTDEHGITEYKLQAEPNSNTVVEAYAEAEGYESKDIRKEVSWQATNNAAVEIILNKATPPNFIVNVQNYQYAPIKNARVDIRLKSDVNKTETTGKSDEAGLAKLSIPLTIFDKPIFAAVSHPDYEEQWSDIPPEYLAPPVRGKLQEFIVHLKPKSAEWVLGVVVDPDKKMGAADEQGDIWTAQSVYSASAVSNKFPLTKKTIAVSGIPPAGVKSYERFNFTVTVTCDTDDQEKCQLNPKVVRSASLIFWPANENESNKQNYFVSVDGKHAKKSMTFTGYVDENIYSTYDPAAWGDLTPAISIIIPEWSGDITIIRLTYKKKM